MHMQPALRRLIAGCVLVSLALVACDRKPEAPNTTSKPPASTPAATKPPAVTPPAPHVEEIPIYTEKFTDDAGLIRALRQGGYILALRHAQTDMAQKDNQGTNFDDCSKQRVLTADGRENAKKIGEWIKQIGIPVGSVLSSPFCRNKDTAQLAFGKVTIDNAVMGVDDESTAKRKVLLTAAPAAGTNTVIVSHQKEMTKSTGSEMELFGEGAALVITPTGGPGGGFQIVHTISFFDWERLAKAAVDVK